MKSVREGARVIKRRKRGRGDGVKGVHKIKKRVYLSFYSNIYRQAFKSV